MALSASDNYNRADGSIGANWAAAGGKPTIVSQVVVGASTSTTGCRWTGATSSDDQFSQLSIPAVRPQVGPSVAMSAFADGATGAAGGTFYTFKATGTNGTTGTGIFQKDTGAGTFTQLATSGVALAAGDVMRLEYRLDLVTGNHVLKGYVNGALRVTHTPATPITGQRYVGFTNNSGGNSNLTILDNWFGGDLPSGVLTGALPSPTAAFNATDGHPPINAALGGVLRSPVADFDTTIPSPAMLGADGLHPNLDGYNYLASRYVNALARAGRTPATGQTFYVYGDSWASITETHYVSSPNRSVEQLATDLGLTLDDRAVGGYRLADAAWRAIAAFSGAALDVTTTGMMVLAGLGLNDYQDADTTVARTAITHALRSLMALGSADQRIEESAFTYGANWSRGNFNGSSGDYNISTSVDGATATYEVTTAGTYYLLVHTNVASFSRGGIITVSQGGVTLGSIDTDQAALGTGVYNTSLVAAGVVRLEGVVPGTLTITHSTAGRTGVSTFVDALLRMSTTPRTILAVKPVSVLAAGYDNPTFKAYIRGQYDALAAELGSHVVVCDPEPGWAPAATTRTYVSAALAGALPSPTAHFAGTALTGEDDAALVGTLPPPTAHFAGMAVPPAPTTWPVVLTGTGGTINVDFSTAPDPATFQYTPGADGSLVLQVTSPDGWTPTFTVTDSDGEEIQSDTDGLITVVWAAGEMMNITISPDPADDTAVAGFTWSYAARASAVLDITTVRPYIAETPAGLLVDVANGTPGETVTFSLIGPTSLTDFQTSTLDEFGNADDLTVALPAISAGSYLLHVEGDLSGGEDLAFTVEADALSYDDHVEILDDPPDVTPIVRWRLYDMRDHSVTWTFEKNPESWTSMFPPTDFTHGKTTAVDGQPLTWQAASRPWRMEFAGTITDQAEYEQLVFWAGLRRRFWLIDHRNRAWLITIEQFDAQAQVKPGYPWLHKYTVRTLIFRQG